MNAITLEPQNDERKIKGRCILDALNRIKIEEEEEKAAADARSDDDGVNLAKGSESPK